MIYLDDKNESRTDIYEIRKNGLFEKDCQNIAEVIAYGVDKLPEFLAPLKPEHREVVIQAIVDRLIREKDRVTPTVKESIKKLN